MIAGEEREQRVKVTPAATASTRSLPISAQVRLAMPSQPEGGSPSACRRVAPPPAAPAGSPALLRRPSPSPDAPSPSHNRQPCARVIHPRFCTSARALKASLPQAIPADAVCNVRVAGKVAGQPPRRLHHVLEIGFRSRAGRQAGERAAHLPDEALRRERQFHLGLELGLHQPADDGGAEAAARRLRDRRPAGFAQRIVKIRPASPGSVVQCNETRPSARDSAPYFAAFVASSCSAMPIACAAPAESISRGPSSVTCSLIASSKCASCERASAPISTPIQSLLTSRSWLAASAWMRSEKRSKKLACPAANVWRAIACTSASMFFERWFTSRIRKAMRSSRHDVRRCRAPR